MFFVSSRRRHTRSLCDWSSDVCSSDLVGPSLKVEAMPPESPFFQHLLGSISSRERCERMKDGQSPVRSEERRVGKECKSGWSPRQEKKKVIERETQSSCDPRCASREDK